MAENPALAPRPGAGHPRPGDVVVLPAVTYALVTASGGLQVRRAPGRAVWTPWDLPDQALLRAELARVLGGVPAPAGEPAAGLGGGLGGGLGCWIGDAAMLRLGNRVASVMLALLAGVRCPVPVRGPVVLLAARPDDPVTCPLSVGQLRRIGRAYRDAAAGQRDEGWNEC